MKIIATMANGNLLIEATNKEVANLCGMDSSYALERAWSSGCIKPGLEIKVGAAWDRLKKIEALPGTIRQLDQLAGRIKDAIGDSATMLDECLGTKP